MNEFQIAISISILSVYIIILLFGLGHKIVIYFDSGDLVISLMPWFSIFLAFIFIEVYQPRGRSLDFNALSDIQTYIMYAGIAISFIFSIWTIMMSITYNRSFLLGIVVGIFKIISVLLGVLILISQIFVMKDKKSTRNNFYFAALVFGVFIWLGRRLINGKRVYLDRGWKLSE